MGNTETGDGESGRVIGTVVGLVEGAALGAVVIPIPFVGLFVGAVAGSVVGSAAGRVVASTLVKGASVAFGAVGRRPRPGTQRSESPRPLDPESSQGAPAEPSRRDSESDLLLDQQSAPQEVSTPRAKPKVVRKSTGGAATTSVRPSGATPKKEPTPSPDVQLTKEP